MLSLSSRINCFSRSIEFSGRIHLSLEAIEWDKRLTGEEDKKRFLDGGKSLALFNVFFGRRKLIKSSSADFFVLSVLVYPIHSCFDQQIFTYHAWAISKTSSSYRSLCIHDPHEFFFSTHIQIWVQNVLIEKKNSTHPLNPFFCIPGKRLKFEIKKMLRVKGFKFFFVSCVRGCLAYDDGGGWGTWEWGMKLQVEYIKNRMQNYVDGMNFQNVNSYCIEDSCKTI